MLVPQFLGHVAYDVLGDRCHGKPVLRQVLQHLGPNSLLVPITDVAARKAGSLVLAWVQPHRFGVGLCCGQHLTGSPYFAFAQDIAVAEQFLDQLQGGLAGFDLLPSSRGLDREPEIGQESFLLTDHEDLPTA